jgi:hypothetical protein
LSAGQDPIISNDSSLKKNIVDPTPVVKSRVPKFAELDMVTYMNLPVSENNNDAQPNDIPIEIPSSPPPACLEDFAPEFNAKLTDNIFESKGFNTHGFLDSSKIPIECLRDAPLSAYQPAPFLPLNKIPPIGNPGSSGLLGSGGFGPEYENPLTLSFSSIGDNDHTTKTQYNIVVKQDQSHITISDDALTEDLQPPTLHKLARVVVKESPPSTNIVPDSESTDQRHTDAHRTPTKDNLQDSIPEVITISEPETKLRVYSQHKSIEEVLLDLHRDANTIPVTESEDKFQSRAHRAITRDVIQEYRLDTNIVSDSEPVNKTYKSIQHKSTKSVLQEHLPGANITPASELDDQSRTNTNHTPTKNILQKQLSSTSTAPAPEPADQPHIHTHTITNSPQTPRIIPTPESPKRNIVTRKTSERIAASKVEINNIQSSPSRSPILTRSRSKSQVPGNLAPELLTEYRIAEKRQSVNALKYEFNDSALVNTMQVINHDESYIRIGDNLHDARHFDQDDINKTLALLQSAKQPMCHKRPGRPMTSPLKRTKDCFSLSVAKRIEWIEAEVNDKDPAIKKRFRAPKKPSSRELVKYNHAIEINNVKKLETRKSNDQE